MALYKGTNLIAGAEKIQSSGRSIGQIVQSTIPLLDAGLHLLDGTLISGTGMYSEFVSYMVGLCQSGTKVPNVVKVGSPSVVNNIASGFSLNNYLKLPVNFQPGTDMWEAVFKVTTGSDVSSSQCIAAFQKGTTQADRFATRILVNGGHFEFSVSVSGSAWDLTGTGTYTVQANTTYWIKLTYAGTGGYTLSYALTEGGSFTPDATAGAGSATPMYTSNTVFTVGTWQYDTTAQPFLGSIDLTGCYINTNMNISTSRFWDGALPIGFTNEAEWQASNTAYGNCGKFVYDSANNTIRLPKITRILQGTTDTSDTGVGVEAGLPNITGEWNFASANVGYNMAASGAQRAVSAARTDFYATTSSSSASRSYQITFNASLSNSIYGNSSTVQPPVVKVLYYIVIANTLKTEIEVDIDEVASDLNLKAPKEWLWGPYVSSSLALSTAYSVGTYTIDLSNYLPNDEYNYVVWVQTVFEAVSNGVSWSSADTSLAQGFRLGMNNNLAWVSTIIPIPVGTDRKMTYLIQSAYYPNTGGLYAMGYCKMGKDS